MTVCDNKISFLFKTLYWFCYAYAHALFAYLVSVAILYTFKIFRGGVDPVSSAEKQVEWIWNLMRDPKKPSEPGTSTIQQATSAAGETIKACVPALLSTLTLFCIWNKEFIPIHIIIFVLSFFFFYLCSVIFLQKINDVNLSGINDERLQYLLKLSGFFVETCYILILFIIDFQGMPKQLKEAVEAFDVCT